jgi:acyl carrier protein
MNELEESLQTYLVAKAAEMLEIDSSEVLWDADVDEFGFDSMEVNRLCAELNGHFTISIAPVVFLEVTSLEALRDYLLERFPAEVEQRLLVTN